MADGSATFTPTGQFTGSASLVIGLQSLPTLTNSGQAALGFQSALTSSGRSAAAHLTATRTVSTETP